MRRRRGVLVRIFRPTFSASPLTTLAGAGEKCGAENESSPRHFEHLCNASENLLPKTHKVPTSDSKARRTNFFNRLFGGVVLDRVERLFALNDRLGVETFAEVAAARFG